MSKPEWTPGPWVIAKEDPLKICGAALHGGIIGEASYWWYSKYETAPANARLMAAAPRLYDALRDLVDAYRAGDYDIGMGFEREAREALSAARGDS